MKFYNFLLSFHILKSLEDSLLSIVNVSKCDHFILLSLYNIFNIYEVVIIYCHFFYKKYFKLNDKNQSIVTILNWPTQLHLSIHK